MAWIRNRHHNFLWGVSYDPLWLIELWYVITLYLLSWNPIKGTRCSHEWQWLDKVTRIKAYKSSGPKDGHQGPLSLIGLTLIPGYINNHMLSKVSYEITYPFPSFNVCTVESWELISNFISSHTLLSMWLLIHAGIKVNHDSKRGPRRHALLRHQRD